MLPRLHFILFFIESFKWRQSIAAGTTYWMRTHCIGRQKLNTIKTKEHSAAQARTTSTVREKKIKTKQTNKQTAHSAIEGERERRRATRDWFATHQNEMNASSSRVFVVFYCFHRTSTQFHPHTGLRRVTENKQTCAAHTDWQGESCDPCTNFHSKDKTKHQQQKKRTIENNPSWKWICCLHRSFTASQRRHRPCHACKVKMVQKQSNRRWGNYTTQTDHFPSPKSEIQIQQIVCRILLKGLITLTIKIPLIVSVEYGTVCTPTR